MSAISLLLRRAYSSSAAVSSAYKNILKETDLKRVAENFKIQTQNSQMRKRTSFYERTVHRLANAKSFNLIEEIFEDQKKYKDITDEGFTVRLITLYGKSGMFDQAHKLFDEMPQLKCKRTVLSFNALLGACVTSKNFDKVEGFFRDLPGKLSIKPDIVSYNNLIKAFCGMGSLDSALSMLDEMEKDGLKPDLITFNILLDAFYKNGFLDGERIWNMMEKYNLNPDIISYNAKLHGLVSENMIQEAGSLIQEIKSKLSKIHVSTYNILFKGLCSDGKDIGEVKKWFDHMMKSNCLTKPDYWIFATLLKFACANNDFQFGSRLCKILLYQNYQLNKWDLMQNVVDGLVKQSNIKDAQLLVRLGKGNKHSCYHNLKMPTFEEK